MTNNLEPIYTVSYDLCDGDGVGTLGKWIDVEFTDINTAILKAFEFFLNYEGKGDITSMRVFMKITGDNNLLLQFCDGLKYIKRRY